MASGCLVSAAEAAERGLAYINPRPCECEWCGRALKPLGAVLNGRVAWVSHEECGCEASLAAAAEEEARKAEEHERAGVSRLLAAGIPKRFLDAPIRVQACERYLLEFGDNPERGLYIHGGVGTGKTELASALARRFVEAGYRTRLTTTIGMLERIRETYGNEASSLEACKLFGKCDVLILDDLGKENSSAWSVMTLFHLVNMRYEEMLPTIVTSQYDPSRLSARIGRGGERETAESVASRIVGMSMTVRLLGTDRRRI
ncbi:MAG: ATP-binding protein [Eggerthellaceae bacterium]|nr:ATP-binding protein [Eggerthellaceae bacterium]